MTMETTGDDGSLDSAVLAITAKLKGGADEPERRDTRENRLDRDITERDTSTDLEESEREEREARAGDTNDGKEPAEAESEAATEGDAEADAYIELPPEEEGGEPLKIPANEAAEAWKQIRQMNGDTATAVIRAEEEAYAKQDQVTVALSDTFKVVAQQAKVAMEMMHLYAPQPPDPIMLDRNGGYYDPEGYHNAKIHYDAFVSHFNQVKTRHARAEEGLKITASQQDSETVRRETERASRYIPEFKDPATREARKAELLETLGKRYGFQKEDFDEIVDHRAWRALNDLAKVQAAEKKAPEVKKHLTETKPKIVNGRVSPQRDPSTGRFLTEASKELKEKGTEDAFVRKLMASGALKNL